MRRAALEQLHQLLCAKACRQVDQRMNMLRIDVVNLHVHSFLCGILGQIPADLGRGGLLETRSALQRCPDQVQPHTRVRMEGHKAYWRIALSTEDGETVETSKMRENCSSCVKTIGKMGFWPAGYLQNRIVFGSRSLAAFRKAVTKA